MVEYSKIFFTMTFTEMFDMEMLDSYVKESFFGIGDAIRLENPRVLQLRPYRTIGYLDVKKILDELHEDGALTYVEERQA